MWLDSFLSIFFAFSPFFPCHLKRAVRHFCTFLWVTKDYGREKRWRQVKCYCTHCAHCSQSYMHDTAHTIHTFSAYCYFEQFKVSSFFTPAWLLFFLTSNCHTHKKENWSVKNSKVICVKRSYAKDLREIVCIGIDLALRRQ